MAYPATAIAVPRTGRSLPRTTTINATVGTTPATESVEQDIPLRASASAMTVATLAVTVATTRSTLVELGLSPVGCRVGEGPSPVPAIATTFACSTAIAAGMFTRKGTEELHIYINGTFADVLPLPFNSVEHIFLSEDRVNKGLNLLRFDSPLPQESLLIGIREITLTLPQ